MRIGAELKVELGDRRRIPPQALHGICYSLVPEATHGDKVPPFVHPWQVGNRVSIRTVNEELATSLFTALQSRTFVLVHKKKVPVLSATIAAWKKMPGRVEEASPLSGQVLSIRFVTPASFQVVRKESGAKRGMGKPMIGLVDILKSSSLVLHNLGEHDPGSIKMIYAIAGEARPLHTNLRRRSIRLHGLGTIDGVVGTLEYDISSLNEAERRYLAYYLEYAEWMGVGGRKGMGFGHIEVRVKTELPAFTSVVVQ